MRKGKTTFGPMSRRLLLTPLVSLLGFLILGGVALLALDRNLQQGKQDQLVSVVEMARGVVAGYQAQEAQGRLSREAAQQAARDALKTLRYSGAEYVWINDLGRPYPRMVMHPTVPAMASDRASEDNTARGATRITSCWRPGAPAKMILVLLYRLAGQVAPSLRAVLDQNRLTSFCRTLLLQRG